MVEQTAEFKKAVEDSRKLKQKPNQNELLEVRSLPERTNEETPSLEPRSQRPQDCLSADMNQLYAHFKQGSQDPPFEQAEKPGSFDFAVSLPSPSRSS